MWEAIWESVTESLTTLPILLVVYVLIEFVEHKSEIKFEKTVASSKKYGPLWGSALGCVPQCGFSALMADLFSKKMITIGTLFAVFVATSDEAIALFLSNTEKNFLPSILILLAIKLVLAIIIGYVLDLIFNKQTKKVDTFKHQEHHHNANNEHKKDSQKAEQKELSNNNLQSLTTQNASVQTATCVSDAKVCATNEKTCTDKQTDEKTFENEHIDEKNCDDCSHNHLHHKHELEHETKKSKVFWDIFKQGLWHTLEIFVWILITNILLTVILQLAGGEETLMSIMGTHSWYQPFICTLIGLIPNCAGSVALVSLYMDGIISFASCLGGLCASAGIGLVILFKNNKNIKQNLLIVLGLYLIGVVVGLLFNLFLPFAI
ncbi:MAG: putative manganese transporter [Christensenellales bacterium]